MVKKASVKSSLVSEVSDKQEHLSLPRLKLLTPLSTSNQPEAFRSDISFVGLIEWTIAKFASRLKDQKGLHKFCHNQVVIDGDFMSYAEINNITIETLYNDSIISWESNKEQEKFFCQGVFRISKPGVEFLTAALYAKGEQFGDEISFFSIVSEKNYENYLKLRNEYSAWTDERNRSNLHIRVIDGEDIGYDRNQSWDDLFLPKEMKTEIISLVENFLSGEEFYRNNNLPWKKGILLYGAPGCGKTTLIKTIISNYSFKPITIAAGAGDEALYEAFTMAEASAPALLYIEDLDSILDRYVETACLLNLLDGIASQNGLLFMATANNLSRLKPSLISRPSRIDRKYEIPLPDAKMLSLYLQKWFKSMFSVVKLNKMAEEMVRHKMSYAYGKELYISTMFEAISNNRKVPSEKDLNKSFLQVVKDKNVMQSHSIDTDRYLS